MLKVEYVSIDSIKVYENNAKIHTDEQVEQIKKSIEEFGMNDPIGVWHDEVVEGHGRLIACQELGYDEVPIIRLDDLSDEQRKAYALVHNKLTMNTGFDVEVLAMEIDAIMSYDMNVFGFGLFDNEYEDVVQVAQKPEVEFTEILGEEHNYIVLYFDNEVDWLQMQSLIDIEGKKMLSTRKDGIITKSMERVSIGRVFNGKEVLERLREQFANIN